MKKLAIVAMPLDDLRTGLGLYLYRFIIHLARQNPDISVTIFINKKDRRFFDTVLFPENWLVQEIPAIFSSRLINIFWIWWNSIFLPGKFDTVFYPALNRRAPLVFSENNIGCMLDLAEYHFPRKYSSWRNFYVKKILSYQAHNVKKIMAISAATANDTEKYFRVSPKKIIINPLGPDEESFYPVHKDIAVQKITKYMECSRYLLYVSRLEHPAKNHIFLIDLFNRLKKDGYNDLQLVFIGSKWNHWEYIYDSIRNSPYSKEIFHVENVAQEDMRNFYSAAECYIHPSLWEGFGYPVVEAMRCGSPVIVANNSSLKEIVPWEELRFSKSEEAENIIAHLLNDADIRREWSNKCQHHSKQYSMKNHVRMFMESIEQGS